MLDQAQIDQFVQHGFLHLTDCFDCAPGSIAHRWVKESWTRNGIDPKDLATWPLNKIHMPSTESVRIKDFAPKAEQAIYELCGGRERMNGCAIEDDGIRWANGFIANYGFGRDRPWLAPDEMEQGWHKDGDFFQHYLDSPEQALLTIIVFSDIGPRGGGTYIAPDSIKHVAEYLLARPEGAQPGDFSVVKQKCTEFLEVTARAGDVFLMHPYMLHSSSFNHSEHARFIINPCCSFKEPMNFNRNDGSKYSPVESAILHALGRESLDFKISGERKRLVPARLMVQAELLRKEKERMGSPY